MKGFLAQVSALAATLGGPGLFAVAFLDSSFLSLPQVVDILVVLMVIQHKSWMLLYATMATVGSVAGCYAIYALASRSGEAFLSRRLKAGHTDRALNLYRRHGLLALVVPALLPPPAPFKLFVLMAGVAGVRPVPFTLGIGLARGARYLALGYLAIRFGDQGLELMQTHGPTVALWLVALIVGVVTVYWLWKRLSSTSLASQRG